eukprot:6173694-Pleurochrysis_carterae.AAC.1
MICSTAGPRNSSQRTVPLSPQLPNVMSEPSSVFSALAPQIVRWMPRSCSPPPRPTWPRHNGSHAIGSMPRRATSCAWQTSVFRLRESRRRRPRRPRSSSFVSISRVSFTAALPCAPFCAPTTSTLTPSPTLSPS